jgi:hypothetical protein
MRSRSGRCQVLIPELRRSVPAADPRLVVEDLPDPAQIDGHRASGRPATLISPTRKGGHLATLLFGGSRKTSHAGHHSRPVSPTGGSKSDRPFALWIRGKAWLGRDGHLFGPLRNLPSGLPRVRPVACHIRAKSGGQARGLTDNQGHGYHTFELAVSRACSLNPFPEHA